MVKTFSRPFPTVFIPTCRHRGRRVRHVSPSVPLSRGVAAKRTYPIATGTIQLDRAKNVPLKSSLFGRPYRIVDYLLLAGLV